MKRIILSILLVGLLVGCSSSTADQTVDEFFFDVEGKTIIIGETVNNVVTTIGEPADQYKSPSCAFDGEDNVYDYESYQITTYVTNDNEIYTGVYILDETIQTEEGIRIGSSKQEMIDVYGEDYSENYGAFTYNKGKTDLSFVIIDDVITAISYLHIVE